MPIRSKRTFCMFAATTTAFQDVIMICTCSAGTAALHDAEEDAAELTVSHTGLHFELNSGYAGTLLGPMFQIRVPKKLALFPLVIMVCTRPSTAAILAIKQKWR